jgi:hypothetical protein
MVTRNRRGRSQTRYSESTNAVDDPNDDEPLDEDDQQDLIESLEREAANQTGFFHAVFGFGIGGMAIVFSLIFPLLCPDECSAEKGAALACWSHALFSSGLHGWSIHPFALKRSVTTRPPSIAVDIILQAIPIVLWFTGFISKDEDHFHLALLIGNFVTFLGARLMYWDLQSTKRSLEDLDAARYRHKSL